MNLAWVIVLFVVLAFKKKPVILYRIQCSNDYGNNISILLHSITLESFIDLDPRNLNK